MTTTYGQDEAGTLCKDRIARSHSELDGHGAYVGALGRNQGGADDNSATSNQLVAHTLTAEGFDASEDGTGRGTPLVAKCLTTSQERQDPDTQDFVHIRTAQTGANGQGINEGETSTLDAASAGAIHGPNQGVRRLTPSECEVLQGFPRGWTCEGDWRKYPRPDGPRYSQMGNAVTVPVLTWLGKRIMEYGE